MVFYAVHRGHQTGIFETWPEAHTQVSNFTGAVFKKFDNRNDAVQFVAYGYAAPVIPFNEEGRATIEVWTDGACTANGSTAARAGYGIFFGRGDPRNVAAPLSDDVNGAGQRQTNNRAEFVAVAEALRIVRRTVPEWRSMCVVVHSDSTYVRKCVVDYLPRWRLNGFRTAQSKPVENKDLIEQLDKLMSDMHVEIRYVKGHAGIEGNVEADLLAQEGANEGSVLEHLLRDVATPEYMARRRFVPPPSLLHCEPKSSASKQAAPKSSTSASNSSTSASNSSTKRRATTQSATSHVRRRICTLTDETFPHVETAIRDKFIAELCTLLIASPIKQPTPTPATDAAHTATASKPTTGDDCIDRDARVSF
jgi:ribonuclease HI